MRTSAAVFLALLVVGAFASPPVQAQVAPDFCRGDVDDDGNVNIADAVTALNYLIGGPMPLCLDAIDINDDGAVTIADPIYLLSFLFAATAPPPPPFPVCGVDSTPDSVDCTLFLSCP